MLASQRLFVLAGVTAVLLLGVIYHNFGQDKYSIRDIANMHTMSSTTPSSNSRYVPIHAFPPASSESN